MQEAGINALLLLAPVARALPHGFTLSFRCAPSPTAQAPYAGCLSTSQQHQAEEKAAAAAAARAQGVGG